jgi:hypothetical protein
MSSKLTSSLAEIVAKLDYMWKEDENSLYHNTNPIHVYGPPPYIPRVNNKDIFIVKEEDLKSETVNHPKHYNSHPSGVECIDIIEHYGFNIGNVIKYLWRAGLKGYDTELQDCKKALWYLQRHIENLEKNGRTSSGSGNYPGSDNCTTISLGNNGSTEAK